jgi:hypothetical protein
VKGNFDRFWEASFGETFEDNVGGGLHGKHAVQRGIFGANSAFAVGPKKNSRKP